MENKCNKCNCNRAGTAFWQLSCYFRAIFAFLANSKRESGRWQ